MSLVSESVSLESIVDTVDNGIMLLDESLNIHFWNRWLFKQTEISQDQAVGNNLVELAPYINQKKIQRKIKSSLKLDCQTYIHSSTTHYLIKIPLKRGVSNIYEFMQQDITIIPHDLEKGLVLLILYDRTTISESRSKLESTISDMQVLNQDLERYMDVIDANVNVLKFEANGQLTYASKSFCHLTGYSNKDLLKTNINLFVENAEGGGVDDLKAAIKNAKSWSGEISNLNQQGSIYWVDTSVTPTFSEDGELVSFTMLFHDITDKKLIEKLSTIDSLTGVFNRKKFDESLTYHISTANRYLPALSLIMIDIDHFKKVNDNYGHLCGDQVLKELAKLVQTNIRQSDIFARWGGEEFVILLSHTNIEQATSLANKLCVAIASHTFPCVDKVTASFGVAQYIIGTAKNDLLSSCDKVLYESKHNGRNRVTAACYPGFGNG